VTAEQIIEEIKRLDPKDQLGVIRFAYQLDAERKLSGKVLSSLAARMTETDDPAEAAIIRESIVTMDQLWTLATTWYSTRLQENSRRPQPNEMCSISPASA
jgi:hypothetical protein